MIDQHNHLKWLQLMQLADSALPIGATAHSFGLETLVETGVLTVPELLPFFQDYLFETGTCEAVYCRAAYQLISEAHNPAFMENWIGLNHRLSALKTARESRTASLTLGRRFLQLAIDLEANPVLSEAIQAAKQNIHHCAAFGLVAGVLGIDQDLAVPAYLQQTLIGLISACQRLMPLGQVGASRLLWGLKPAIIEAAARSQQFSIANVPMATPLLDLGSMRHPALETRLFIS